MQHQDSYMKNAYVSEDRQRGNADSEWQRSFSCTALCPLIVCRGPVRKEALDVFNEMGMTHVGILLSEKDSIVYPNALAPELRAIDTQHVHRVPDYTGASKEERQQRVAQIIQIAHEHGYNAVFAGYGFMAEDEDFVAAIEGAGLRFIGPCSGTVRSAGRKDEAKRTALREKVSVTPGIDNATARALVTKHRERAALLALIDKEQLQVETAILANEALTLEELADEILNASYKKGIDILSIEELCLQIQQDLEQLLIEHPGRRFRLKAIGGGGGKGQRILDGAAPEGEGTVESRAKKAAAVVPEKVREILSEVKANGVGDNKNMLLELNIEQTRHHEIQLVGNGQWCMALGGRDCSLQMHEQKLLEVSITQEALGADIDAARAAGREEEAKALHSDLEVLRAMEQEAEAFGRAVGLDSASTFECIVDTGRHFFMEVNTRIQVEHRVSELCYGLRFANPESPDDAFVVNSLVEMMALLALHKERLPQPTRVRREVAAAEVRLNATDRSLSPHAGGVIRSWSDPLPYEIRDDQGICVKNPDTGLFVRYKLAGAYDSNVALLVTVGDSRKHAYDRLYEILRQTTLRGNDLATNLEFHFGLLCWFKALNVNAKPTTRFVAAYLAQVGLLKEALNQVDFAFAYSALGKQASAQGTPGNSKAWAGVFEQRYTLLLRPIMRLVEEPHCYSAWLSVMRESYRLEGDKVVWLRNPLSVLAETYELLHLEAQPMVPAAHAIWADDQKVLSVGLGFYEKLAAKLGDLAYPALLERLEQAEPPAGMDAGLWQQVQGAHMGHQAGLQLLDLLVLVAREAGFYDLQVNPDLTVDIPTRLLDGELQARMRKVLVPPPATRADEIVAERGGMFYAREAPHLPPLVEEGQHFEVGDPLYVLEVMKMFTKVCAPFAGTVDRVLLDGGDGLIIQKGQPLFKVTPDVKLTEDDGERIAQERRAHTTRCLARVGAVSA